MGKNYAEVIRRCGLVPVIALDDPDGAVPLARALLAGGITVAEITFRTAAAQEAIRRMREVPGITVGAGTVLTHEQADRAIEAGAEFLVTPGFNPDMVRYAQERGIFIVPGTSVPGEMEQALALGLETVKFFPAEQSGGAAKLKADTRQWLDRLERGYDLLRTDMDATVSHTANELERVQHSLQGVAADFETYDRRLEELIKAYQEGEN